MTIQSIKRAVAILRSFSEIRPEMGVTELAAIHAVHKSTVSRILATLEEEEIVTQNKETGKYRLGIGLVGLAGVALGQISVRGAAQPEMARLTHEVQETTILMVRDGLEAVTVEWFGSTQALRYVGWIGRRVPLYCTAAGRLMLAWLPSGVCETLLPPKLHPYTRQTISDRSALIQELACIKKQGWALVQEEFEEGFSSIAAPVQNHRGELVAALTIAMPSARLGQRDLPPLQNALQEAAIRISENLGYAY